MTGRVVVLAWSPRVAPGLFSWPTWQLLHSADAVLAPSPDHPLIPALAEAGIDVEVLAVPDDAVPVPLLQQRAAEADEATLVWLPAPDLPDEGSLRSNRPHKGAPVEVLPASWDLPGARLLDLVRVMDRLRSPGGCPWDADQTHESLVTYLLEESYETVEAIESGDLIDLREELGDLLLQVVFHARVGEEHAHDAWSIDDVAAGITAKLVRRHPHVFGDVTVTDKSELEQTWEQLKQAEKGRTSVTDGVPLAQPALALSAKLHDRARRNGLPLPPTASVPAPGAELDDVTLGAELLALVTRARAAGLDPEAALRAAARRYADELRAAESSTQW
jgi:XTP/dITP diphosphohydrolase